MKGFLPICIKRQSLLSIPETRDLTIKILQKTRDRIYIMECEVQILIPIFDVVKGLYDIKVVYETTKSELNNAVWLPYFLLPIVSSAPRIITAESGFDDENKT